MDIAGSCPLLVKGRRLIAIANQISNLQCEDQLNGLALNFTPTHPVIG